MVTGLYTGNGNATQAITGLGFQPSVVYIFQRNDGVTAGPGVKTDQIGTRAGSRHLGGPSSWQYDDDHIISLDVDGFTVGDGTGSTQGNVFNTNTVLYAYICWG